MDENELKEIDAAIDAATAGEQGKETADKLEAPETPAQPEEAETQGAEAEVGDDGGEAAEPFAPDDALVERAVKAGLSLADARAFTSKDSMERILTALEATAPKTGENNDAGGDDDFSAAADDPFADVDLDEIDENIVKAMKAMSAQNAAMRKEIETLKMAGESAKAQDRFSQLVGTLDESVQKGMDAATRSHLKKQFDILSAGYKATNTEKKDADIFAEAAKLAIGDRMTESAERKKAEALAKRKSLALAKPGGEGAARRLSTISGDGGEYADIIAGLQEKGLV